jgi:tripartite-type tricarboxylate transporter receptor subunit TctC
MHINELVTTEWYGLLAPAGTPRPIVDKLNAEMKRRCPAWATASPRSS